MSWLARSIANTLKLDDDDEDGGGADDVSNPDQNKPLKNSPSHGGEQIDDPSSPTSPSRGVKEDISELTKTLTRQFWGVASFLAPPPQAEPDKSPRGSDLNESSEKSELSSESENSEQVVGIGGIKSDFAEIGGKFRSGISKLSSNIAVSEFTKIASNLLLGSDDEGEEAGFENEEGDLARGAIGVTEEVVAFARDISMHPGTWLDFPLPGDEDDDSFELSDIQQEHALAVERFVPLLSSLRMELCPGYMSESLFWKIYFVLLHPQLNEHDAALLSTPPVLETRALLSHQLPTRPTSNPPEGSEEDISSQNLQLQSISKDENVKTTEKPEAYASADPETEKHAVESSEIQIVDKSMIEEDKHVDQITKDGGEGVHSDTSGSSSRPVEVKSSQVEDDYDDWLKEEDEESSEHHPVGSTTNNAASSSRVSVDHEEEEDVSFSDLEEDDDDDGKAPTSTTTNTSLNANNAQDWLQVNKASSESSSSSKKAATGSNNPETKDSTDWLDVDIDES